MEPSTFQVVRSGEDAPAGESTGDQVFVIEESLGYQVNYLAKLLSQILAASLAPHGIYLGQWGVLLFLWVEDGLSQKELSRRVAIEEASMVRSLDRMERDGLAKRVRNEQDRRQINVFLTEKGRALRDQLVPYALAGNAVATQGFTEEELRLISALLRRMIGSLEQALSPDKQ
ncbi:MAG TPA: MarR family transcriptional regulator [Ktedonosporobacter sp.]|nr:MarR family transcriptional regulator [Ktedonosporobacter sp.]